MSNNPLSVNPLQMQRDSELFGEIGQGAREIPDDLTTYIGSLGNIWGPEDDPIGGTGKKQADSLQQYAGDLVGMTGQMTDGIGSNVNDTAKLYAASNAKNTELAGGIGTGAGTHATGAGGLAGHAAPAA